MMELKDVARAFDQTPVYDADTGDLLFHAQVNNYDGSHRDAHAAYRRVLSVAPGTSIPDSGAVTVYGQDWVVAAPQFDGLGELHRQRHVMQRATDKVAIYALKDYLTGGQPAHQQWADVQWASATKEKDFSSYSPQMYDVFIPVDLKLTPRMIVQAAGYLYLGQFQYDSAAGFTVYRSFRQEYGANVDVQLRVRKYDPAQGKQVEVSAGVFPSIIVRWQEFFEYTDTISTKFDTGDKVFILAADAPINTSSTLTALGRTWSVQGIQETDGVKAVHGRPV